MHRMQIENVFPFRVDVYAVYIRERKRQREGKKKKKMQCRTWPMVHCSLKETMTMCGGLSNLVADEICRSTMEWKIEKIPKKD